MQLESKPLFSLTVEEFILLTKRLVEEVLTEKSLVKALEVAPANNEEAFNIEELRGFLRCSKASIHNYKKRGMPFYRVGRKILFRKIEVLNFMKSLKNRKVRLSG